MYRKVMAGEAKTELKEVEPAPLSRCSDKQVQFASSGSTWFRQLQQHRYSAPFPNSIGTN